MENFTQEDLIDLGFVPYKGDVFERWEKKCYKVVVHFRGSQFCSVRVENLKQNRFTTLNNSKMVISRLQLECLVFGFTGKSLKSTPQPQ